MGTVILKGALGKEYEITDGDKSKTFRQQIKDNGLINVSGTRYILSELDIQEIKHRYGWEVAKTVIEMAWTNNGASGRQ